jgi:hypothetical protein
MVTVQFRLGGDLKAWAEQMLGGLGNRSNSPLNRAMQGAISATLTTARKRIAQEIRKTINLPARQIKAEYITLKRPSYTRMVGSVSLNRRPVPMADFGGATITLDSGKVVQVARMSAAKMANLRRRPKQKPVKVKVRKRSSGRWPGGTELLPHAFYVRMPATIAGKRHLGVYQRTGEFAIAVKGRYKGHRRERIAERYGLTAAGALAYSVAGSGGEAPGAGEQRMLDQIAAEMGDVLAKNMASQIDRFLRPRASNG